MGADLSPRILTRTTGAATTRRLEVHALTITWAKHNAAVSAAISVTIGTNAPAGDRSCAAASASITSMRGGRPVAIVHPMGTTAGAANAKPAADTKKTKPPLNPST